MRLLSFMSKTSIQSPNPSLIIAFQNIWMENSNIFPKYLVRMLQVTRLALVLFSALCIKLNGH